MAPSRAGSASPGDGRDTLEPPQGGSPRRIGRAQTAAATVAHVSIRAYDGATETEGADLMPARFTAEICPGAPGTPWVGARGYVRYPLQKDDLLDAVAQFGE
jgi:hypothetical protein